MASSVFYKFNSQRDESRVTFNGTGISVFDLKKEIILASGLSKATDFDLCIFDSSSGEEFRDDSHIIPRSTSVIAKRRPAARNGKGNVAVYLAGAAPETTGKSGNSSNNASSWHKGSMSRRFDGKEEPPKPLPKPATVPLTSIAKGDESAAMAAMFQAQSAVWEETQEKMSHATRIYTNTRGTGFNRGGKPFTPHHQHHQQSDRPLPPSYVCYRCGQKGHWIQDCPTNSDREFDNKPRIKRTTGIPRSFLKAVDNPAGSQIGSGIMVTPEGGYVVAQPDSASWQKQVTRPKGLTESDIRERPSKDPSIVCSVDNRIFRDAVKTPCCSTSYCEECIQTHLLEKDFLCPKCGTKIASLDKLAVDKPTRAKVLDYIDKEIESSKEEESQTNGNSTPVPITSQTPASDAANSNPQLSDEQQQEAEFYQNQPSLSADIAMSQMIVDSIPQLQAQIHQISQMLQNPTLPNHVRQQTEMQHHQLQIQLSQAQTIAAAFAMQMSTQMPMQVPMQVPMPMPMPMQVPPGPKSDFRGGNPNASGSGNGVSNVGNGVVGNPGNGMWTNPFSNQQPAGHDSAYQRLPLNNRRRNVKRDRPLDFLEMGQEAEREGKIARYWE
ncbi:hypothetical protein HETIRDRAFT_156028 [Heterobasidion irregulare TC 32-1]|uniref:DWNN-domain-containing protein n=1 Tax=Heterobasidion irregulare (strain TC 32-1) TaxID=747525 RepID=W4K132_HETIT|nr:uncharacterized protein HETIRDRAFT_156028 [Heterobasidion irregulare TC 32-1]ETW79050.1 hypothetical protein HETIRDRAFT_156028 [Heterobasidion irregulare TC 32-1]